MPSQVWIGLAVALDKVTWMWLDGSMLDAKH